MCKLEFNMWQANLTQYYPDSNWTVDLDMATKVVPANLTNSELSHLLLSHLNMGKALVDGIGTELPVQSFGLLESWEGVDPMWTMFALMAKYLGLSTDLDTFLDTDKLGRSTSAVLRGLTFSTDIRSTYEAHAEDAVLGTFTINQTRLHIRTAPLVIMFLCVMLMACLAVATSLSVRNNVVPQQPGAISSYATILTKSLDLNQLLGHSGGLEDKAFKNRLQNHRFKVEHSQQTFSINIDSINIDDAI